MWKQDQLNSKITEINNSLQEDNNWYSEAIKSTLMSLLETQNVEDKVIDELLIWLEELKQISDNEDKLYKAIELLNKLEQYKKERKKVQSQATQTTTELIKEVDPDGYLESAKAILWELDLSKLKDAAKKQVEDIKAKIKAIQDKVSRAEEILTLAIEAKNIYDKYISWSEEWKDAWTQAWTQSQKWGNWKNEKNDGRIDNLKELKLKGLIKWADNIQKMVQNINEAIESWNFTPEEIKVLKSAIENLENLDKVILPKIDDDLNQALNEIDKSKFPTKINILWEDVFFNTKEQAINAIKTIKEELWASKSSMLSNYALALIYLITSPSQPWYRLSKPLFKWWILNQWNDIKDNWEWEEWWDLIFADLWASLLMLYIITNINSTISFALRESVWRTFKNTTWILWINLMEDYSKKVINPMDLEWTKSQEYQEFVQREAILKWLKKYIEFITDNELKEKLEKDYKKLEKYKLIKWPEFFFKANLIANEVGLKNFKNFKYYRNLGLSILNWARFHVPSLRNYWKEWEWLWKLKIWKYIKWINFTKWISFEKQILNLELESIIEDGLEDIKEEMNKYFKDVLIEKTDDNDFNIEIGEIKKEILEKIEAYINWKTDITKEEKEKIFRNVKWYLEKISANNLLISEEWLWEQITKLVDKRYLTYDEIKDIILKDKRFKEFLNKREIKNYLTRNRNIKKRFFGKNKKFINLITLFKEWKIEWNEKMIKDLLEDFLDWREIKENYENIDNNLTSILEEWENILKSIEKAKDILEKGSWKNLFSLINLDKTHFNENFEPIFESIYDEIVEKVNNWQYTEQQLKLDLAKIYKWYLPNFVILDIFHWKWNYEIDIDLWKLNLESKEVKEFLEKVEKWEWHWTIEELNITIEKLNRWKKVTWKSFNENIDEIIKEINKRWPEFEKLSFKNTKYSIPFKDWQIDKNSFETNELKKIKQLMILEWKTFNDEKFHRLFEYIIDKKWDYTWPDFFKKLLNSLWLNNDFIDIKNYTNRTNILEEIQSTLDDKIEIITKDFITKTEKERTKIKVLLQKAWLEEKLKELEWFEKTQLKERQKEINRIETQIWKLENYMEVNIPQSYDDYKQAREDLLEKGVNIKLLPVLLEKGFAEQVNIAIQEKLTELYIHRYGGIDKIPTDILEKHKFLQDSVLEAIMDTNLLQDISVELKQEIRWLEERLKIEIIDIYKDGRKTEEEKRLEIEQKVREFKKVK